MKWKASHSAGGREALLFADGMILHLEDAKTLIFKNLLELIKEFSNAAGLQEIK